MIVSYAHKFIFLHCRKAAGSSVKLSLIPALGNDDIVIGSANEAIEKGLSLPARTWSPVKTPRGAYVAAKYLVLGKSFSEAANNAIKDHYRYLSRNPPHATATQIARHFNKEWNEFFRFAIVRNPYTQVVSDYYWRKRSSKVELPFSEFLDLLDQRPTHPMLPDDYVTNWEIVSQNGAVPLDHVGKFETLDHDLFSIANRLRIPLGMRHHAKAGVAGSQGYAETYRPGDREKVRRIFAPEIEHFGYNWPF